MENNTEKNPSWEIEFDKWTFDFAKIGGLYLSPSTLVGDPKEYIKSFIKSVEKEAFKDGYEAAKEDYHIID